MIPTDKRADEPVVETRREAMNMTLARNWWALVLRGVVAILFGIIAILSPGAALLSLAVVFAAYLLLDGILAIIAAVRAARGHERWGSLLCEGILNLIMGAIAAGFPGAAIIAFVLVTAVWAIVTGVLMLRAAFNLYANHGRWWLGIGGVVSVSWGILLAAAPMIGAVVLTWWLGAYALIFGIMLLALGFQLRGRRPAGGMPAGMGRPKES